MRVDRSKPEPSQPKAQPWDNQGLRDRLEGKAVEDTQNTDLDALHELARERLTAPDKGKRSRLRRR